jgi:hypothetical protein
LCGDDGVIKYAVDPTGAFTNNYQSSSYWFLAIDFAYGRFVTVAGYGIGYGKAVYAIDPVGTWTLVNLSDDYTFHGVAHGLGYFVVVGSYGELYYKYAAYGEAGIAIDNDGTMSARPVFEISGMTTDFSIQIGSAVLTYPTTMSAGQTLTIDCEHYTADVDGTNVLSDLTGSASADFLELSAGNNTVTFYGTLITASVTTTFTERYL